MQHYREARQPRSQHARSQYKTIIRVSNLLKFAFFALLGLILLLFILTVWYSRDLPTPGKLANPNLFGSTKILDKNGVELYSLYKDYHRVYVPLKDIPKSLQNATVVVEDKDFYSNKGFSLKGYARALRDIIVYRKLTGGSTLTQQLVKNVLLTPERSINRKIKEFILAIQVEQRFTKDQVLEMYLNDVSYGGTAIGVEAASNLYFDKSVKDLTLAESAFLAGLPQAPTYYSPYSGTDKAYVKRTSFVINRLEEEGIISGQQKEKVLEDVRDLKFSQKKGTIRAPHFVMYVREQLIKLFGENLTDKGNLTVSTTLDYDIQKNVEEIVETELDKLKKYKVGNGAVVVLDPKSGAILAMVGSRDYFDIENDGNFNAALALRQPGSSLKPIMYATAFEKGYTPSTLITDVKTEFPTDVPSEPSYTPVDYDGKYRGPVQLRFALGNSLNIPAVKMLARVGIKPVMQKAYDMGIENWNPTPDNLSKVGLSLVLGGREVTLLQAAGAYAVFANEGIKQEPFSIVEVKDSKGNALYKHEDVEGVKILSPEIAFLVSHILLDNNARQIVFGPNSLLVVPGKTVAVKTGTTDSKRDNWTVGYTKSYVVATWVGNNDNSPMNPVIASGVTGAAPIWNKVMQYVLKGKPSEEFAIPEKVVPLEIDAYGGGLPVEGRPKRTEYFMKGTEPNTLSPVYKKIKLSKHQNGKLANSDEVSHGDYDTKDYLVFSEQDPVSKDGKNRWQEGIDAWLRVTFAADHPEYYPPTETSDYKYETPTATPAPSPTPSVSLTPTPTPTLSPTPTGILPTILTPTLSPTPTP